MSTGTQRIRQRSRVRQVQLQESAGEAHYRVVTDTDGARPGLLAISSARLPKRCQLLACGRSFGFETISPGLLQLSGLTALKN